MREEEITIDESDNTCDSKKAEYLVPWGGKLHKCCYEHAKQLKVLGNVIGQPVDVQPIITEQQCYQVKKIKP